MIQAIYLSIPEQIASISSAHVFVKEIGHLAGHVPKIDSIACSDCVDLKLLFAFVCDEFVPQLLGVGVDTFMRLEKRGLKENENKRTIN